MADNEVLRVFNTGIREKDEESLWGPGIQNNYALHYIINGVGYLECEGKKYRITKGQSFVVLKNKKVFYYPDKNEPWSYIWVSFTGSEAKSLLKLTAFGEHPVCDKIDVYDVYKQFLHKINSKSADIFNSGLLRILISKYIEAFPSQRQETTPDYLYAAKQYISANYYRQDFNVCELANAIGLERSYLYRLFRESENTSVIEYIINARLESAKRMLDSGITQIKVISYSTGYENPLYFSNAFKKKYGMSPKRYLEHKIKNP